MSVYNYPNHPLFRIAPLLNRGFGTVLHDEYTSHLVGRIRAGRYMPELWDSNGFYLSYPDRSAISTYSGAAIKSRHKMTQEQLEEYRAEMRRQWAADAPQREERRTQRAAEKAEKERRWREWVEEQARVSRETEERKARRAAERERREREWAERTVEVAAETEQRRKERADIMAGSWECSGCRRPAAITPQPDGTYMLECDRCARCVAADHATLIAMMNAHNIRLKPLNHG